MRLYFLLILLCCCQICAQTENKSTKNDKIESLILELDNWPSNSAQKAAKNLYKQGKEVIPFLILKLKEGKPAAKEACAECLGRMKATDAFLPIASAAGEKEMRGRISTLFRALVRIDRERAYRNILEFLKSSTQTSRYPAFQILAAITSPKHFPLLEKAFNSKYSGTRQYIVELVGRIKSKEAANFLLAAMDDKSVQVAFKAAETLGSIDNDNIRKMLFAMGKKTNKRLLGYATLALTMQEDNFQKELLDGYWIPQLLLLMRDEEHFTRGAAAVGLVNVGFRTENPEIIAIMDKQLAPTLIESIMGRVYYQDYAALRKIAYVKLKQLSGEDFGYTSEKWWSWWHSSNGRFHAVRLLKGVSIEDVENASISYHKTGGEGIKKLLLITNPEMTKAFRDYDSVVVLDSQDMVNYLNHLKEVKFFDMDVNYGIKLSHSTASYTVKIKVKHLEKEVVSYEKNGGVLKKLIKNIEILAKDNNWQLYWDNHRYPNWLSWYRSHKEIFRRLSAEENKNNKLKEMILDSYGWLKEKERAKGAKLFLELMEKDNALSDGMADLAILHIRTELGINENSEAFIKAIALTRKTFAITLLVEYLLDNYSLRARSLILFLLKKSERKVVSSYLKHGNPLMRSMAVESLAEFPQNELTNLYLMGLIKDENIEVRKSTIYALGELKVQEAVETLEKIIRNNTEVDSVNSVILKALAKIQGEKAISILLEKLTGNETIRMTVTQALSEIPSEISVKTLIAIMIGDASREVRILAAGSLSHIGTKEVTKELLKLAQNQTMRAESRTLALQTLQRYKVEETYPLLYKLLEDSVEEVRIEAAFLLVNFWDKKAIPSVIEALDHPSYKFSAAKHIAKLSFVVFEEDAKKNYIRWWEENKDLSVKEYYFHALRKRKYHVTPFLDYLLGEKNIASISPLLLDVLESEDWFLQAGTCYILEDLTEKNFGDIQFYTGQNTREKIVGEWIQWFEAQKSKGR